LTAMTDITGSFEKAVLAASEVLAIRGEIYPSTLTDVRLRAELEDETVLVGEVAISGSHIGEAPRTTARHARITHLALEPPDAEPTAGALAALAAADLIIIGPGSLYTSVLPNLVIRQLAEALRNAKALRVYVCNVMTQPNETDSFTAQDHLRAIVEHAGLVVDVMVMNGRRPSESIVAHYAEMNQDPVQFDLEAIRALGVTPFFGDIIAEDDYVRHDPDALAKTIFQIYDRYGRTLERMRKDTQ
ncbi:MAG TPA: gluconeogenesis factor YvcK family protein, partial [Thermoanaerobaculia bacterium]|nr:gluconeogenesis factor YvcK family protein [Thermoanaerobaculia bacterium]